MRAWRPAAFRLAGWAIRGLAAWPGFLRDGLFSVVAFAAWAGAGRVRRRVHQRLSSGLGRAARRREVLAAFQTVGRLLSDTVALADPRERADRRLHCGEDARRAFAGALEGGRGVVFITAHLGPWERMGALLAAEGFPTAAVAAAGSDPGIAPLFELWRRPRRVRAFYRDRVADLRRVGRELESGGAVGFLVDLPSRRRGAPAELFGAAYEVARGPFRLAMSRGAEVVVGTPAKRTDGSLEIRIDRVRRDDLPAGAAGEAALRARCLELLDRRIRGWPEGWLGLYVAEPRLDGP